MDNNNQNQPNQNNGMQPVPGMPIQPDQVNSQQFVQPNVITPQQQPAGPVQPSTQPVQVQVQSDPNIVQPQPQNIPPAQPPIQTPIAQNVQSGFTQPQNMAMPQDQVVESVQPQPQNIPPAQPPIAQPGMAPSPQPFAQQPTVPLPPTKKPPLVTLVAKLTFKGTEDNAPKTLLTKIFGIAIVVVAILGTAGNIYATRHIQNSRQALKEFSNPNAAQREKDKKQAVKDSEPETQDLKDGKLDVSKLFDGTLASRPQDIKAEYNKQINMSNGQTYAVTGVERGWLPGGIYSSKPAKGKEFIRIKMQIGWRAKEGEASTYLYKILNSKGGLQDTSYASGDSEENGLENASITAGSMAEGWLLFEVDKNESVTLVYEAKGFDYELNNGKEFSIKSTVDIK